MKLDQITHNTFIENKLSLTCHSRIRQRILIPDTIALKLPRKNIYICQINIFFYSVTDYALSYEAVHTLTHQATA